VRHPQKQTSLRDKQLSEPQKQNTGGTNNKATKRVKKQTSAAKLDWGTTDEAKTQPQAHSSLDDILKLIKLRNTIEQRAISRMPPPGHSGISYQASSAVEYAMKQLLDYAYSSRQDRDRTITSIFSASINYLYRKLGLIL